MEDQSLFISGPVLDLSHKEKFLGELLYSSLKKRELDQTLQVMLDTNEKMTFGELFQLGAQICQSLLQQGLQKGDIATIIGYNSNKMHAIFVGVIWAGGVPHPIEPDLKVAETSNTLKQVKPRWILCRAEEVEVVSSCLELISHNAKIILYGSPPSTGMNHLRLEDILVEVNLNAFTPQKIDDIEALALVICSSGTTGFPKCVGLSHRLLLNIHAWDYIRDIGIRKPYLLTSSFSWITGIYFLFMSCIYGNFRAVTTVNKPRVILKAIQDYKLYGALIPPSILRNILDIPDLKDYDLTSLKEVWSGGSPLGKHTIEKFHKEWSDKTLSQCYGLTEAGGVITRPAEKQYPTSIGRLIYNVDAKIQDPESERCLGPNACGEICLRANSLFITYIGNEEAMKSTVKNGWLRTGDIGYYTEDGHLYITSRLKEIIKIDNHQISPVELETYISSLPGVDDVGVSGITKGEYYTGLMALVAKSENSTVTADYVKRKVEENFNSYKHLTAGVYFLDSIPRSISGKIKRKYLSEIAETLYSKNKEA